MNADGEITRAPGNNPETPQGTPRGIDHGPVFNLPMFIKILVGLLILIHLARQFVAGTDVANWLILSFAFIPARYSDLSALLPVPLAAIWSPLTYSLLHADWTHLLLNILWLVAFGSPVAQRLGWKRVLILACLTSMGGAVVHYLSYPGEMVPMIGASAIDSGYMGAAARFAFNRTSPNRLNVHGPALSIQASFANPQFLAFVLVWFGLNFLFGSGLVPLAGEDVNIAWQAHVGGFLVGLLAFSFLDTKRTR
ncbi:MAG: rhomboid family intramembrane serine protease [Rhizobiaceae bacterium]